MPGVKRSDNYIYVQYPQKGWRKAEQFCRDKFGTNLASVHSDEEMNEITDLINGASVWIGLHDIRIEKKFRWIDKSDVDYTKWAPGEPNDDGNKNEDCVITWINNQYWNDGECHWNDEFVCKTKSILYLIYFSPPRNHYLLSDTGYDRFSN